MSTITQTLMQQGYIGATGTTPYTASSAAQVATLQNQYNSALNGQTISRSSAIQLTLNFDGTQNNREFLAAGESQTNVASLYLRQREVNEDNSFYYTGVGAQTVSSDALLPNGNPDPRSSPSNLESTPWRAGEIGNEIIDRVRNWGQVLNCNIPSSLRNFFYYEFNSIMRSIHGG